jgi:pyrroloquinoline quinone (PQQ) biosynthesis protein C
MIASGVRELVDELNRMANAQFESPEFQHLLSIPLTRKRAQAYSVHMARYVDNRRDCWGFVLGAAPLEVKRWIWKHEEDELILDPRAGTDHSTLSAREAETLGMSAEEFARAQVVPAAIAAFYAWIHLSKDRPWLEAFAASSMLERRNDDSVIQGGGFSRRMGFKMADELGIPLKKLTNATVHMDADLEHSKMLEQVAERYADTEAGRQAMLRGARETFLIDRAFRGAVAEAMEDIPD